MANDPRRELGEIAASLRAYLEVQQDTGAWGIPRGAKKPVAAPVVETRPEPEKVEPPRMDAPRVDPPTIDPPKQNLPPVEVNIEPKVEAKVEKKAEPKPLRPLDVVKAEVASCAKCGLAGTRTNTVFSRGNPAAKLVFVGEAPGADEDEQGLPFVGRAGQLLDKMIAAMGLDPEKDVYVCNIIKCRPPGNRRPEPAEIDACIPFLHEQIAAIDPKVIVAMGNTAVGALLNTKLGITKVRGSWKLYKGKIPLMPTYHPSYLIRPSAQQAEAKKQAWEDLQAVMKELGLQAPKKKS
jgi:uracil-DNA glycosylase family 4